MVEVFDITKEYHGFTAIDSISFSVPAGSVLGFVGSNGAGKTTTMKMLTANLLPTSGTAIVSGYPLIDSPHKVRESVGYLPETPPLYDVLTVGEQLDFIGQARGCARKRIGEVIDRLSLGGWENVRISALSKGYRQRVGLAQAIVHQPNVLILDEPMSGLDPLQIADVRQLIRQVAEYRTVILSTHVLSELDGMCDSLLILDKGRIVANGTISDLKAEAGTVIQVMIRSQNDPRLDLSKLPMVQKVERTIEPTDGIHVLTVLPESIGNSTTPDDRHDVSAQLIRDISARPGIGQLLEIRTIEPTLEDVFLSTINGTGSLQNGEL